MPLNNVWFLSRTATCMYTPFFIMWLWLVKDYPPPPPIHLWLLYWTSSSLILARQINFSICPLQMVLLRYFSWICSPATDFSQFVTFTYKHTPSKISSVVNWLLYLYCLWLMSMFNGYRLLKIPFPNECLCRGSLFLPHSQALPWFRAYYHLCLTPRWKAREECSQWNFLSQRAKTLCVKMCIIAFFIWDFEST